MIEYVCPCVRCDQCVVPGSDRGPALTITVTDEVLIVTIYATDSDYNTDLPEEHLIGFLKLQAS